MFLYIVEKSESDNGDDGLTNRYHDGGGLVIIANQVEHALELVAEHNRLPRDERHGRAGIHNVNAATLLGGYYTVVNPQEPRLWLFPNAGCC